MRRAAALLTAGLAVILTACAGLPTSGPVNPGNRPDQAETSADFAFVPDRPQPGATPQQIVDGFIRAGSGPGPAGDWATARLFLSPEASATWRPNTGVTIDRFGERSYAVTSTSTPEDTVTLQVTPEATVDATGAYRAAEGGTIALPFRLERRDDGEWRIAEAPDGIVLNQEFFASVYRPASVLFFDQSWTYLVPDLRWFPRTTMATRVAQALVDGAPSEWLARSVTTAFPESLSMVGTVALDDGVAQVELGEAALGLDATTLDRMQAQLQGSLASVGFTAVQMTVASTPLVDAQAAPTRPTEISSWPLVERGDGMFGFLGGEEVEAIPGLSGVVESLDAADVVVDADRQIAAVLTSGGSVVRARADGTALTLDSVRSGLVAPSVDPQGYIWSVPRLEPTSLLAYPPGGGDGVAIANAWPGATQIQALQVSRDGTRLAGIVTTGGHTEIWVAGIERDQGGAPGRLGVPTVVGEGDGAGVDITWLDDATLGVLLKTEGQVSLLKQPVGGRGTIAVVPADVTTVVGGNSTARLLSSGSVLYLEQGANWQQTATGVRLLATQQGSPR